MMKFEDANAVLDLTKVGTPEYLTVGGEPFPFHITLDEPISVHHFPESDDGCGYIRAGILFNTIKVIGGEGRGEHTFVIGETRSE